MSARERLPDRRQCETVDLMYGGRRHHLTVGFYDDGRPGEVFLHGAKVGSDSDGLNADVAVILSRLLQHGDTDIAAGMGRQGRSGQPISLIGAVADRIAEIARAT